MRLEDENSMRNMCVQSPQLPEACVFQSLWFKCCLCLGSEMEEEMITCKITVPCLSRLRFLASPSSIEELHKIEI